MKLPNRKVWACAEESHTQVVKLNWREQVPLLYTPTSEFRLRSPAQQIPESDRSFQHRHTLGRDALIVKHWRHVPKKLARERNSSIYGKFQCRLFLNLDYAFKAKGGFSEKFLNGCSLRVPNRSLVTVDFKILSLEKL
jgi:hypothetical protein